MSVPPEAIPSGKLPGAAWLRADALRDAPRKGLLAGLELDRVQWTPALLCLMLYTLVVTTYLVLIGDYAIVGALTFCILQYLGELRLPAFLGWFAGFLAVGFIQYLGGDYPEETWKVLIEIAKLWVVAFVVVNAIRTMAQLRAYALWLFFCVAIYPARTSIVNYIFGYNMFGRAIGSGDWANPNQLATLMLICVVVAAGLAVAADRKLLRNVLFGAVALFAVVVFMTGSRGVFVGIAAFTLLYVLFGTKRRGRALVVVGALFALVAFVVPSSIWDRFLTILDTTDVNQLAKVNDSGSAASRFQILEVGWNVFKQNVLFGAGLGTYPIHVAIAIPSFGRMDAHNTYMGMLAETGLLGTVFYVMTFVSVGRAVAGARKFLPNGSAKEQQLRVLGLGLIGLMVIGIWITFRQFIFTYVMLALLWLTAHAVRRGEFAPATPRAAAPRGRGGAR